MYDNLAVNNKASYYIINLIKQILRLNQFIYIIEKILKYYHNCPVLLTSQNMI